MKPYLWVLAAFALIASFLLVPEIVYAQFGGGGGGMRGGDMGGGKLGGHRPPGDWSKACDAPGDGGTNPMRKQQSPLSREQLQYQMLALQTDLQLNAEQSSLWQTFTDRVLALEADQSRQRSRGISANEIEYKGQTGDSIKQVARAVDTARNRLAALEDIETSSRALYQALQSDQKSKANARLGAFLTPLLQG